jgi:hypothetical protein
VGLLQLVHGVTQAPVAHPAHLAAIPVSDTDGDDTSQCICLAVEAGARELCIEDLRLHQEGNQLTARLHIDVSRTGQRAHNEYLIWDECGTRQYRLLSRQPIRLPTIERWQTVQASGNSENHRTLHSFGTLACVTSA